MKISYNWLKKNLRDVPSIGELTEAVTFGVFEVESVENITDDTIIDLKVLPDRAHYALSWNGLAYEICAILDIPYKEQEYAPIVSNGNRVEVNIEDPSLCSRYMARSVEGVKVVDSPQWLKSEIEAIGQRSINSLVDMANYVMFTTGQPLHIFDADKLSGKNIIVRRGRMGEKLTTLDDKAIDLDDSMIVIADTERPLGIAGVKGGKNSGATSETKNIIIESANFDPVLIRRASTKVKIKTEASKRFENEPSPELCKYAMDMISSLINSENREAVFGEVTDVYSSPVKPWTVEFRKEYIESRLGRSISDADVESVLRRIRCNVKSAKDGACVVEPPFFRLDLKIEDDFVEEIGRLLGYEKVLEALPPKIFENPTVDAEFFISEKIKDFLVDREFSEVILYTLGEKGDLETLYPVAEDKAYLRTSLLPNLEESMVMNMKNADLLGLDEIKTFEIGKAFDKNGEYLMLALAVAFFKKQKGRKPSDALKEILSELEKITLKTSWKISEKDGIAYAEASLEDVLPNIKVEDPYKNIRFGNASENLFRFFSRFPFAVRDVAVFVPNEIMESEVRAVIEKNAGDKAIRLRLFDVFRKDQGEERKTSYAYRLVFQSSDKTLTEDDINSPLGKVYEALKARGWEIR